MVSVVIDQALVNKSCLRFMMKTYKFPHVQILPVNVYVYEDLRIPATMENIIIFFLKSMDLFAFKDILKRREFLLTSRRLIFFYHVLK